MAFLDLITDLVRNRLLNVGIIFLAYLFRNIIVYMLFCLLENFLIKNIFYHRSIYSYFKFNCYSIIIIIFKEYN